jgi:uncharacterized protein YecA (UPF0149 family)
LVKTAIEQVERLNREDDLVSDDFDPGSVGTFVRSMPKVGRNDPCWCGSGKKYKKCHLSEDEATGVR